MLEALQRPCESRAARWASIRVSVINVTARAPCIEHLLEGNPDSD
jgi:hypothetical protein